MTKITNFSDEDCQAYPSPVQQAVVNNHADIGSFKRMKFLRDNVTVLFECSDGWVACAPAEANLN